MFRISASGSYTSLYSFNPYSNDGVYPKAGLVQGSDGNFYGTTLNGGYPAGLGTVFRISPSGSETILYAFSAVETGCYNGSSHSCDGMLPYAGLVQGSDSNFYGTTWDGGVNTNMICDLGCGTVFGISTNGGYTSLYSFSYPNNSDDGEHPAAGLVQGSDGNFYGTTEYGGTNGYGTVFRISPSGSETTLYSFVGPPTDGANLVAGLVQGSDGNFYGTTQAGGTSANCSGGCGTVFRISPSGTYTSLYSFGSHPNDGANPNAGLVQGSDSNFYGTTSGGGTSGHGTVFRISPSGSETNLYSFGGYPGDGANPIAGLVQGRDGNFYGTTSAGGANDWGGTVFKLSLCNSSFMPQVSAIQIVGTNVVITLPTVTCQTYQLQYSESMTPTNWIDIGSIVAGTGSPIMLTNVSGALHTQRFYRVEGTTGGGSSPSIAREAYQLRFTADLTSGTWSNVPGVLVTNSIGCILTLTNFAGANQPQGFYRFAITL